MTVINGRKFNIEQAINGTISMANTGVRVIYPAFLTEGEKNTFRVMFADIDDKYANGASTEALRGKLDEYAQEVIRKYQGDKENDFLQMQLKEKTSKKLQFKDFTDSHIFRNNPDPGDMYWGGECACLLTNQKQFKKISKKYNIEQNSDRWWSDITYPTFYPCLIEYYRHFEGGMQFLHIESIPRV